MSALRQLVISTTIDDIPAASARINHSRCSNESRRTEYLPWRPLERKGAPHCMAHQTSNVSSCKGSRLDFRIARATHQLSREALQTQYVYPVTKHTRLMKLKQATYILLQSSRLRYQIHIRAGNLSSLASGVITCDGSLTSLCKLVA